MRTPSPSSGIRSGVLSRIAPALAASVLVPSDGGGAAEDSGNAGGSGDKLGSCGERGDDAWLDP